MDWDRIEANWKHFIGEARGKWGRITVDELDLIGGRRETLAGQIREVYGITKEEAEKQLAEWQQGLQEMAPAGSLPSAK
jgi:uncharacterized protein YjbJ (UPF0337 family)